MKIEAVLFDIDGTLVDSNEQHVAAWLMAFSEEGHAQAPEAIRRQIGKGGDQLVPALLHDVDAAIQERISDAQGSHFKRLYLKQVSAFPRASDLTAAVYRSGRKVVLASSAGREEVDHYSRMLGIADLIEATTSIDDVERSKPAPDIFGAALGKIGVAPEQAIVVGDTPYDVEAALKAGVQTIGVTSGPFSAAQLMEAGAVAVYADVADLLGKLAQSPLAV